MKKKKVLMAASVASMIDQFNMPNIRLLLELGYEVHVACNFLEGNTCDAGRIIKLKKRLREMSVLYYQWDCPRKMILAKACIKAYRQLLELAERQHFAWIHCHSPIGGALVRIVAHQCGIRVIYTAHGFHFYQGAPLKNWLLYYPVEKLLSYWTDVLVTVNQEDLRFARRNLNAKKVYRIPGVGIDLAPFQKQPAGVDEQDISIIKQPELPKTPKDAVCLLSVGELSRRKNHRIVLSAIAALQRKDLYYLICGQGKLRYRLKRQAQRLGIADQVNIIGYQEHMAHIYKKADIFVLPSIQEGLSVALMEAMAAGLPCIVSDIRGNRELISDKKHTGGIRFLLGRQKQLQDALTRLADHKELRHRYGMYNQDIVMAYRLESVQRRMQKIYQEMEPKGTVSVLVALYNPNLKWLEELLHSIQRQTYVPYEVLLMDDGSRPELFPEILKVIEKVMDRQKQAFVYRNSQNEGSNRTFEKLVLLAKGAYIAFCDQDDIWEKDKLEKLVEAVRKENAVLSYSDLSVMDEDGNIWCQSLRRLRKGLRFVHGNDKTTAYLAENCSLGCSMLARTDLVKRSIPFSRYTYCDQWVAAYLSAYGRIAFVNKPLVRYRRHGANQTGTLMQIQNKRDYYKKRVLPMVRLTQELKNRGITYWQQQEAQAFGKARKNKDIRGIWKYRRINRKYAYFDILMILMPDAAVRVLFSIIKNSGNCDE